MHRLPIAILIACLAFLGQAASGQEKRAADGTGKIKAAIQSYAAAFNARDAKKLAAHWSPDGVYTSRTSGEQSVGRDAIAKEFTAMFAGKNVPKLALSTESIEMISPNVALERGTATVTHAADDVVETRYSVVYVNKGDAWLIDRVTEDEVVAAPSNYEHLKALEWLIGEWVDTGEGISIEFTCDWTKNQNFISRKYAVTNARGVESSGLQIIGWDAKEKQIRSWLFDSSGGFITGKWTQRDDRWVVQSEATLADGRGGSFTSVFRPLKDGTYLWKKINRVADGELLPNVDEVVVRRK